MSKEHQDELIKVPQKAIINGMVGFLQASIAEDIKTGRLKEGTEEHKNRATVVERFRQSKGECAGLAVLWGYAMKIDEKTGDKPKDDIRHFRQMCNKLGKWQDEDFASMSQENKLELELFISNVILYQGIDSRNRQAQNFPGATLPNTLDLGVDYGIQINLEKTLIDTKGRKPEKKLDIDITTDRVTFQNQLSSIVQPGAMTYLAVSSKDYDSGHQMAFFKRSNSQEVYFFDPNEGEFKYTPSDTESLSTQAWRSANLNDNFRRPDIAELRVKNFNIQAFKFADDTSYEYPKSATFQPKAEDFKRVFGTGQLYDEDDDQGMDYYSSANLRSYIEKMPPEEVLKLLNDKDIVPNAKKQIALYATDLNELNPPLEFISEVLDKHSDLLPKDRLKDLAEYVEKELRQNQERIAQLPEAKMTIEEIISKMEKNGLNPDLRDVLIHRADELDQNQIFKILKVSPGDTQLVDKLLSNREENRLSFENRDLYESVIKANIDAGKLDVAIKIIANCEKQFNYVPSKDQLKNIGNIELVDFVAEKYGDRPEYYQFNIPEHYNYKKVYYYCSEDTLTYSQEETIEKLKAFAEDGKTVTSKDAANPQNQSDILKRETEIAKLTKHALSFGEKLSKSDVWVVLKANVGNRFALDYVFEVDSFGNDGTRYVNGRDLKEPINAEYSKVHHKGKGGFYNHLDINDPEYAQLLKANVDAGYMSCCQTLMLRMHQLQDQSTTPEIIIKSGREALCSYASSLTSYEFQEEWSKAYKQIEQKNREEMWKKFKAEMVQDTAKQKAKNIGANVAQHVAPKGNGTNSSLPSNPQAKGDSSLQK